MRRICLSLLVALLAFKAYAHADDWSKTYDLTGKPELRVLAHDANLRIETWDQSKIEAHVATRGWHIGNGGIEIVEHQQGNAVELELRQSHHAHFSIGIDARRIELEIRMPRSAKINVRSGDGAVFAKGVEGELDFTTNDGHLELEDVDGSLRAHTSDSALVVEGSFSRHDIQGKINGGGNRLTVHTSDGSATLDKF